jgi:hypothetical protein
MDKKVLEKLKESLWKKYSDFNKENLFIEIQGDPRFEFIVVNWHIYMDNYVNYKKLDLIKKYMYNYLKKNNQKGFFYVGDNAIEVK